MMADDESVVDGWSFSLSWSWNWEPRRQEAGDQKSRQ